MPADHRGKCQAVSPSVAREHQQQTPASMLVYDEVLQQQRRLLSKLDLEEKKRKEAREEGGPRSGGEPVELDRIIAFDN